MSEKAREGPQLSDATYAHTLVINDRGGGALEIGKKSQEMNSLHADIRSLSIITMPLMGKLETPVLLRDATMPHWTKPTHFACATCPQDVILYSVALCASLIYHFHQNTVLTEISYTGWLLQIEAPLHCNGLTKHRCPPECFSEIKCHEHPCTSVVK